METFLSSWLCFYNKELIFHKLPKDKLVKEKVDNVIIGKNLFPLITISSA